MDPNNDLDFALTMIACSLESQIRPNLENLTDGTRFGQIVRSNPLFSFASSSQFCIILFMNSTKQNSEGIKPLESDTEEEGCAILAYY